VARRVGWKDLISHHAEKIDFELAKGFEAEHFDSYLQMANSQQGIRCVEGNAHESTP
jgi:hypothetical protein